MSKPKPVIKTRIRTARKHMGMTLTELATLCGTSVANMSRWEREPSRINLTTLADIARALSLKPHQLLLDAPEGEETPEAPRTVVTIAPLVSHDAPLTLARHHLQTLTDKPHHALRCMLVRDDAMQPTLSRGDWVLLEACAKVDAPGIYVGGDATHPQVRRIAPALQRGYIDITTDSPSYPDHLNTPAENFPVYGKLIWVTKTV